MTTHCSHIFRCQKHHWLVSVGGGDSGVGIGLSVGRPRCLSPACKRNDHFLSTASSGRQQRMVVSSVRREKATRSESEGVTPSTAWTEGDDLRAWAGMTSRVGRRSGGGGGGGCHHGFAGTEAEESYGGGRCKRNGKLKFVHWRNQYKLLPCFGCMRPHPMI